MKIFITGGTGFLGRVLTEQIARAGHKITLLTRKICHSQSLPENAQFLEGDPSQPGLWQEKVASFTHIINLAGSPIFERWNSRIKNKILNSRLLTTRHLVQALKSRQGEETLLINASAVGYYGFCGDELLNESAKPGNDFLATVASQWEQEAEMAKTCAARVILCRFGIILGKSGGSFAQMLSFYQRRLGGRFGNGRQWFSWIHIQDLIRIFLFLLKNEEFQGPVNCTAPNPVTNREMTRALNQALHLRPLLPFIPGIGLKLVLGEFAESLLNGQRVYPEKLVASGFKFQFPEIEKAFENLTKSGD